MARAAQNKIDELAAEQLQVEIDFNQKIKDQGIEMTKERYEELTSEIELIKQKELSSRREEQLIDKIIDARERRYLKARENFEEDQDRIEKDIETLVEYTKIEDEENKKRGGSRRERSRMFKEADLDYEKEILKSQDRVKKLETPFALN